MILKTFLIKLLNKLKRGWSHYTNEMNFAVRLGLAERFCSWRGSDSDPKLARHPSERLGEGV